MRWVVESWSPEMGAPFELGGADSTTGPPPEVDLDVEVPAELWQPLSPRADPASEVLFIDGVRRIDARLWLLAAGSSGAVEAMPAVAASWAAGAVRCGARARIVAASVGRGVFSTEPMAALETRHGRYLPKPADGPSPGELVAAVQRAMREAERAVAEENATGGPTGGLTVVDGPLHGRSHLAGAVGYVKSHRVEYLPPAVSGVVAGLEAGQRTPVFRIVSDWQRWAWYLRLARVDPGPWSGVVRCEVAEGAGPEGARAAAELTAATLPRFASSPHRDPRAPQNLTPVGGLERELRRRLGDPGLLLRALRRAAAEAGDRDRWS